MSDVHVSVRNLVEFILRSGDIDTRAGQMADPEAMQMGSRMHRKLQKQMGSLYQAEVPLELSFHGEEITITVEGRADGIFAMQRKDFLPDEGGEEMQRCLQDTGLISLQLCDPEAPENAAASGEVIRVIDEIKGVFRDIHDLTQPVPVHLAQAKCYAFLLMEKLIEDHADLLQHPEQELQIGVQMTYAQLETEEIVRFRSLYSLKELEAWFTDLLKEYRKWALFRENWRSIRQDSIHRMTFPFAFRPGQKQLSADVYRTISRGKNVFVQAPTGTGKTLAVLFPALKAVGEGLGDTIFYLTARTIARTVAQEGFNHLRRSGLVCKTVVLTAKEKICPLEEMLCNPVDCPYAKGHYDRINDALYTLLMEEDDFSRERIEQGARRFMVCPYELSLDLSQWVDAIIGDYNYVFHPRAKLRRYFGEGVKGDYLFLVDESHHLAERGREMYSAGLVKEDFLEVKKAVKGKDTRLSAALACCSRTMLTLRRQALGEGEAAEDGESAGKEGTGKESAGKESAGKESQGKEHAGIEITGKEHAGKERRWREKNSTGSAGTLHDLGTFPLQLMTLCGLMEEFLEKELSEELSAKVRELYFQVSTFLEVIDHLDENYLIYGEVVPSGRFSLWLFCVDPSARLQECLDKARSTIFFSATLLPVDYYKRLLSSRQDNYAVYAESCFDPNHLQVIIGRDVRMRYQDRGQAQYQRIARYLEKMVKAREGNYLFFFPSYTVLGEVAAIFAQNMPEGCRMLCQSMGMSEEEREQFLQEFSVSREGSLAGFCVMGSIFGEGIDLQGEALIGAAVIGTGLPQVCARVNLLKAYYDGTLAEEGKTSGRKNEGFRFAYLCPGMNKVLQAAGRVIRTEADRGIVLLLDERFTMQQYTAMFPREWTRLTTCTVDEVDRKLEAFWTEDR